MRNIGFLSAKLKITCAYKDTLRKKKFHSKIIQWTDFSQILYVYIHFVCQMLKVELRSKILSN